MNTKKIMHFLKGIAANNNKQWFQEHKAEYDEVKEDFEKGVDQIISKGQCSQSGFALLQT